LRFALPLDEPATPMPDVKDPSWYVRLPDGRVLRAAGPSVIRQQLDSGRLPPGIRVRRSGETDWRPPERVVELADAAPAATNGHHPGPSATIASRLDPDQMQLAGVRGLLDELLGALDATFVSRKLKAAAFAGLLLGGLAALSNLELFSFSVHPLGLGWLLPIAALVVWSWLAVVLSKMTFAELSRLRPATWADGTEGSIGATIHLSAANVVMVLMLGGIIAVSRLLPGWLLTQGTEQTARYFAWGAQAATVAGAVVEVLVWPLFILLLQLAALVVIEQTSFTSGSGKWLSLVWRKGRRLLMAEILALGIGLLLTAPLALLGLAVTSRFTEPTALSGAITCVLYGLLSSLLLAYLVVANVFIYLSEAVSNR
jgi:hypothetical protein